VRRESKPEVQVPKKVAFSPGETGDRATGWIVRLSIVGAEIESLQPPATGAQVVVWAKLAVGEDEVALRGRVQWATQTKFAVQFGPLGAREANAVVRASRSAA
jgi:hypothetical protein